MALFLFSYTSFKILFREHRYAQKTLNWLQFGYRKLTFSRPVAKSSYRVRLDYLYLVAIQVIMSNFVV